MSHNPTLAELRADFRRSGGRFLSLPLAGAVGWTVAGLAGAFLARGRPSTRKRLYCS